jgi:hypothetical protein
MIGLLLMLMLEEASKKVKSGGLKQFNRINPELGRISNNVLDIF